MGRIRFRRRAGRADGDRPDPAAKKPDGDRFALARHHQNDFMTV